LAREFGFLTVYGGGKKELELEKILAVPSVEVKHRSKCDVWERGYKNLSNIKFEKTPRIEPGLAG